MLYFALYCSGKSQCEGLYLTMWKMCLKSKIEVFLRGSKQQKKAALIDGFFHNVESHIKHYAAPDIDSEITNLIKSVFVLHLDCIKKCANTVLLIYVLDGDSCSWKTGMIYSKCKKTILLIYAPLYSGFYKSRRRRKEGASVSSAEAFGAAWHARVENDA